MELGKDRRLRRGDGEGWEVVIGKAAGATADRDRPGAGDWMKHLQLQRASAVCRHED
jgi:hypothetical protein